MSAHPENLYAFGYLRLIEGLMEGPTPRLLSFFEPQSRLLCALPTRSLV